MKMKRVYNKETDKTTYYVNDKRVSQDKYDFVNTLYKRHGCFLTSVKGKFIFNTHTASTGNI